MIWKTQPTIHNIATKILTALAVLMVGGLLQAKAQSPFVVQRETGRVTSLKLANDKFPTEYVAAKSALGDIHVTYREGNGAWLHFDTASTTPVSEGNTTRFTLPGKLVVESTFSDEHSKLIWRFKVTNLSPTPIEIGDLAIPLPMNGPDSAKSDLGNTVLKHSFISGDGSFLFWVRPNSVGPYLMLTPLQGTAPEYWDAIRGRYQVYVHSKAAREVAKTKGGTWRIPESSVVLKPGATSNDGFAFQWAKDYDDIRDILAKEGHLDVQVVPGMTVPNDLDAEIAVRSSRSIQGLEPEFPKQTSVHFVRRVKETTIFRVKFARLGENRLTVRYGNGLRTYLEFFSTEPIETLIQKRAAFLARCRHQDPTKWYDGLISEWNMETQTLLGPDNYDRIKGWRIYEVTCDDPGLGKPSFLAAKNAEFPVQSEVDTLDYYIEHFVWGGLQQTTQEPYPYGIYGIPDWKTLRQSKAKPADGVEHIWRVYDYPHVVLLYLSMYQTAVRHPEIRTHLKPLDYLERAFGTAEAMFTVPAKVVGWSAYETGFYNERVILNVIDALQSNGLINEADKLRKHWEEKVKFFVQGKPDLFGSEYAFDSTGFESTHALARYALDHGNELGIEPAQAQRFMDGQMAANIFCRGSIEPAYYLLGSDYRGSAGNNYTLSYMSQLGAWSVLDYGLHQTPNPAPYLRLGYASFLSSWALMNTGTPESNYGYWYPGKANDGGAGGGFEPAPFGQTWLDQPHHRGSWYYGCEIDLGYSGALRSAATVVTDDPIFGRICLGGSGREAGKTYRIAPKDGLRKRLFIRTKKSRADVLLDGVRFSKNTNVDLKESRFELRMPLSCDSLVSGKVVIDQLPAGNYEAQIDGGPLQSFSGGQHKAIVVPAKPSIQILTVRVQQNR